MTGPPARQTTHFTLTKIVIETYNFQAATGAPPNPITWTAEGAEMGVPFDYTPDRPEHIDAILNSLNRYNPETTSIFQEYVTQQCEERTVDSYANLALLKL